MVVVMLHTGEPLRFPNAHAILTTEEAIEIGVPCGRKSEDWKGEDDDHFILSCYAVVPLREIRLAYVEGKGDPE